MSGEVNPGVQHTCRGGGLAEEVGRGQVEGDVMLSSPMGGGALGLNYAWIFLDFVYLVQSKNLKGKKLQIEGQRFFWDFK